MRYVNRSKHMLLLGLAITAIGGSFFGRVSFLAERQSTFYVSPEGDDANPGTKARPFKTLERARGAVRSVNRGMARDVIVYLRGGTYSLQQTLAFDQRDSGSTNHCVIYRNYAGEHPVISGGKRITGWSLDSSRWKAQTDVRDFRQLYVNNKRAILARGGRFPGATLVEDSPDNRDETMARREAYLTSDSSMASWRNPGDIELVFDLQWTRSICKVARIRKTTSGAILTMLEPYFSLARMKEGRTIELPTAIQNAFELLDEPGEWYLDKSTHTVYYLPREGEHLDTAEVIAPALEKLVELRGSPAQPVHHIRFEGITFEYATWLQPSRIGHIELQANFTMQQTNLMFRPGRDPTSQRGIGPAYLSHPYGEAKKSPANIVIHAGKSIVFYRCRFIHLGGAGIDVEVGSEANSLSGNEFYDISGSAIQIGDVIDHHPKSQGHVVKGNQITNNYIHNVAVEYIGGVGIFVGYTDGTYIAHNEITKLPYTGISIGWGWGEADADGGGYWQPAYHTAPTTSRNNICEYNHIHHVLQELWDGGGIYTLGNMPGSIIRGNLVHDNIGYPGGIYLDEGSGYIEVSKNVVYNTGGHEGRRPQALYFNNRRQDRIKTCRVHDNIVDISPDRAEYPHDLARQAGLEPGHRHLLCEGRIDHFSEE
ncbi:MAG: right-handed parallel beta-helix repeat-containing protein [Acidobacteriota bacterium]